MERKSCFVGGWNAATPTRPMGASCLSWNVPTWIFSTNQPLKPCLQMNPMRIWNDFTCGTYKFCCYGFNTSNTPMNPCCYWLDMLSKGFANESNGWSLDFSNVPCPNGMEHIGNLVSGYNVLPLLGGQRIHHMTGCLEWIATCCPFLLRDQITPHRSTIYILSSIQHPKLARNAMSSHPPGPGFF